MRKHRARRAGPPNKWPRSGRAAAKRHRRLVIEPLESRTLLALTPQLLSDINKVSLGAPGPITEAPLNVGGVAYWLAGKSVSGLQLWKSNGTAAGTVMLK